MSDKSHLEELVGEKLYTAEEALNELGWEYTYDNEAQKYRDIKCCGQLVSIGGWFGDEHAHCRKCGKGMQSALGVLPAGPNTACMIDLEKYNYEEGRVWFLKNVWGEVDGNEG